MITPQKFRHRIILSDLASLFTYAELHPGVGTNSALGLPEYTTDDDCDRDQVRQPWSVGYQRVFLESALQGFPVGMYVRATLDDALLGEGVLPGCVIDGFQRLRAFADYFSGKFSVYGSKWTALSPDDQRRFLTRIPFPGVEVWGDKVLTRSDIDELRALYQSPSNQ